MFRVAFTNQILATVTPIPIPPGEPETPPRRNWMSAASLLFEWVFREDFCCPSSNSDLFSPLTSEAAYLGRGGGQWESWAGWKHWSPWTQMDARIFAWPPSSFSGSVSHVDKSPTRAHFHCRILISLCLSFCSDHQTVTPHPKPPARTSSKKNCSLGWFILRPGVCSGDAHLVGLIMKVLNLNSVTAS